MASAFYNNQYTDYYNIIRLMVELLPREKWKEDKPQDQGRHKCPLCEEDNDKYCLWEGKYLKILHNKYPMLGIKNHLMLIPKRHVVLTSDLNADELQEMSQAEAYMEKVYAGQDYFSFIRQSITSRSLEHLHYHYLPGNIWYKDVEQMLANQGF